MDPKELEEALKKYWNAQLSDEEEKRLREYFRSGNVNFQEAGLLFSYFDRQRGLETLDDEFDRRFIEETKPGNARKSLSWFNPFLRAAAVGFILLASTMILKVELQPRTTAEDTFANPEMAFETAREALLLVSQTLNKGQSYAGEIARINLAKQIIEGDKQ